VNRRAEFHPRIESLRGVAALMVALFHSIHLLPVNGIEYVFLQTASDLHGGGQVVATRLLMLVFNGGAAVSLFFVMSGLVLALSLDRDDRPLSQLAPAFVARRFFRIYPPLALNVLVYAAAMWAVSVEWPALFRSPLPTGRDVFDNLILVGKAVNGATWSLAVEMLAVPFILIVHLLTRGRRPWVILVPAVLARIALFTPWLLLRIHFLYWYLFMFIWGMAIPPLGRPCVQWLSRPLATAVFGVGVVLLLAARFVFGYWSRTSLGIEGIGATLLIAIVAYGPEIPGVALLDRTVVRFFGRTSYSFYLYHPLLLSLATPLVVAALRSTPLQADYPLVVGFVIAVVTIVAAALFGKLSFDWIERPSVRLGRRLEHWLFERRNGQIANRPAIERSLSEGSAP
jgi:peptidoglycan/LPS O-acetylase OafA/YrhL